MTYIKKPKIVNIKFLLQSLHNGEGSTTDADPATQAALVQNVLLFAAKMGNAEMIDTCLDEIRKLSLPALKKAIQEDHLIATLKLARFIFGKIETKVKAEAQEILDLVMEHYTDFVFSDEDHVSESIIELIHLLIQHGASAEPMQPAKFHYETAA
jgi:hypothetical protein